MRSTSAGGGRIGDEAGAQSLVEIKRAGGWDFFEKQRDDFLAVLDSPRMKSSCRGTILGPGVMQPVVKFETADIRAVFFQWSSLLKARATSVTSFWV